MREATRALFPNGDVPSDQMLRRPRADRALEDAARSASMDKLDTDYWTDPDGLADRLQSFAQRNGLLDRFT